jgi:hypothetical protein
MRPRLEDMRLILTYRQIKVASAPHVSHQTLAHTHKPCGWESPQGCAFQGKGIGRLGAHRPLLGGADPTAPALAHQPDADGEGESGHDVSRAWSSTRSSTWNCRQVGPASFVPRSTSPIVTDETPEWGRAADRLSTDACSTMMVTSFMPTTMAQPGWLRCPPVGPCRG